MVVQDGTWLPCTAHRYRTAGRGFAPRDPHARTLALISLTLYASLGATLCKGDGKHNKSSSGRDYMYAARRSHHQRRRPLVNQLKFMFFAKLSTFFPTPPTLPKLNGCADA